MVGNGSIRLLSSNPPHLGDENERGQDGGLKDTQKHTSQKEASKVLSGSCSHGNDTPCNMGLAACMVTHRVTYRQPC